MKASALDRLYGKVNELQGMRRGFRRPRCSCIFKRAALITPNMVKVVNYTRNPVAVFNPGAHLEGGEALIFPRLIFDYLNYTSSIGAFKVNADDLVEGRVNSVEARILIWPRELWEFRGCEDPRIFKRGGEYLVLYTGWGYYLDGGGLKPRAVQALARLNTDLSIASRGFFKIRTAEGSLIIPDWWKDSAIMEVNGNEALMLTRPTVNNVDVGWFGVADLENLEFPEDGLKPILWFEDFEFKVGWSTNAIKLSSNEYLVGWHGVAKEDYSYRDGLALVDDSGELLAISDYLLEPRGIEEEYGDRPRVIFGGGLILYKGSLIWIGGVSDYAIGIYVTELDKALGALRWLKG